MVLMDLLALAPQHSDSGSQCGKSSSFLKFNSSGAEPLEEL